MILRAAIAALLIALCLTRTDACLWDRDTLAEEASGQRQVIDVITGRFPRNPPLFYEARLFRVIEEIDANPTDLALYDDAGVACERLGRSAEAVDWMQRKAAVLAATPTPDRDQLYRYHANLGTFLIHQWLATGADPEEPEGVLAADQVRKAIALNPDAHFGREAVQLQAIEWLLEERGVGGIEQRDDISENLFRHASRFSRLPPDTDLAATMEGVVGLVALGSAWESVDLFRLIAVLAHQNDDASISYLAELRVAELLSQGRQSLAAEFPQPYEGMRQMLESTDHLDAWYLGARSAAEDWQSARWGYIEDQIPQGKHPDTHEDFWAGFDPLQFATPELPQKHHGEAVKRYRSGVIFVILGLLFLGYLVGVRLRQRRQKPTPATS